MSKFKIQFYIDDRSYKGAVSNCEAFAIICNDQIIIRCPTGITSTFFLNMPFLQIKLTIAEELKMNGFFNIDKKGKIYNIHKELLKYNITENDIEQGIMDLVNYITSIPKKQLFMMRHELFEKYRKGDNMNKEEQHRMKLLEEQIDNEIEYEHYCALIKERKELVREWNEITERWIQISKRMKIIRHELKNNKFLKD